jgi:hypothetical protein
MLQMSGIGPMFGQFNHFDNPDYANEDVPYAKNRFGNEARRLIRVLESQIGDVATYPWLLLRDFIGLPTQGFPNIDAWCDRIAERPATKRTQERWDKARVMTKAAMAAAAQEQQDRYFGRVPRSSGPRQSPTSSPWLKHERQLRKTAALS